MKIFYCEFLEIIKHKKEWFKFTIMKQNEFDSTIFNFSKDFMNDEVYFTNSKNGYKVNIDIIEDLRIHYPDINIVTNLPYLLSNEFAWNTKENKSEIYLWSVIDNQEGFRNISDLTTREIREGHNIEKMYRSGEFDHDEYKNQGDLKYAN